MNGTRLLRRVFALLLLLALITGMTGCFTITISPRYVTLSDDYTTLTATPDSGRSIASRSITCPSPTRRM